MIEKMKPESFGLQVLTAKDLEIDWGESNPAERLRQQLTRTQKDIIGYVLEGLTNNQIALKVNKGQKTVEKRLSELYIKFGVKERKALANLFRDQSVTDQNIELFIKERMATLKPIQKQALFHLLNGLSNKEMASKMFTSEDMVEKYNQIIFVQFGLNSRYEVIAEFIQFVNSQPPKLPENLIGCNVAQIKPASVKYKLSHSLPSPQTIYF
jgi:DNA-binding NarL/FixJ family response regulator